MKLEKDRISAKCDNLESNLAQIRENDGDAIGDISQGEL